LANSHTIPPEYDFQKDANGARVFMWNFLRYRKGKLLLTYIFQQLENDKQNVDIAIPWKHFCGRPLMYETTRFFKHFPKKAWTSFSDLLANPIQ